MAWDTEMVTILRVMINDLDSPYKFTDTRLKQLILSSCQIVNSDAAGYFNFEYIPDIDGLDITPDPTDRDAGTRDDNYVTLSLLRAACFVDNCNAREAARKGGVSIREYNTSLDTTGLFRAALSLLESDKSYCAQYQESVFLHMAGESSFGKGVFGPFRLVYNAYNSNGYSYGNTALFDTNRR
jgi:hypothetical protein